MPQSSALTTTPPSVEIVPLLLKANYYLETSGPIPLADAQHDVRVLARIIGTLSTYKRACEAEIVDTMVAGGARELLTTDGITYKLEEKGQWLVPDEAAGKIALRALVAEGVITASEYADVVTEDVPLPVTKFNHTRLNSLARKRGKVVEDTVAAIRTYMVAAPKLTWVEPKVPAVVIEGNGTEEREDW